MKIDVPSSNTKLEINVADLTFDECLEQLASLWGLFKALKERGVDEDGEIGFDIKNGPDIPWMRVGLSYSEWDGDEDYMDSALIMGMQTIETIARETKWVQVSKEFAEFAKTNKTFHEYCKERFKDLAEVMQND